MKFVIQRVSYGSVKVDQKVIASINKGYVVLIGIGNEDTREIADQYIKKMINLRIFQDQNGKTNLSLKDVGGELLLISQFTLYANCKKGNRPSFINAGDPAMAEDLFHYITAKCKESVPVVQTGQFGAEMKVELCNDGPFTIVL